jgi:hypothetical protein
MHATRDDDPDCVAIFASEAIQAGTEALILAKNARQIAVTESLVAVAGRVAKLAQESPQDM